MLGGVPIYLNAADRSWIQHNSPHIRLWEGDRLELSGDLELIHLPGHFAGSTGLWWKSGPRPGGSLFPGDAILRQISCGYRGAVASCPLRWLIASVP